MKLLNNYKLPAGESVSTRDGFGQALVALGERNKAIVVLTADLAESTRVLDFAEKFPERFFEVGVAEQNLVGIAAGLALTDKIPFIASYAAFSPGRNFDQIRVSIAYSNANVKIVGSHAGLSVGPDGATHQALEDIAMLRALPNMIIIVPCDYIEAGKATRAITQINAPNYLRLARNKWPIISSDSSPFEIGKAVTVSVGTDITIIANGPMVAVALQAAAQLQDQISIQILNMHTVKPLDVRAVVEAARHTGVIITAEDHQQIGGLGSAVSEVVAEHYPIPVIRLGVADSFGQSGEVSDLMEYYGLDVNHMIAAIKRAVEKKHAS